MLSLPLRVVLTRSLHESGGEERGALQLKKVQPRERERDGKLITRLMMTVDSAVVTKAGNGIRPLKTEVIISRNPTLVQGPTHGSVKYV